MADENEAFRLRLRSVFDRWSEQLQSVLWEVRPRLVPGVDTARLATMVIAVVEGMLIVGRVKRDAAVVEGIASELQRYLASQLVGGHGGMVEAQHAVSAAAAGA
jgi:hypothetical protein